MLYALRVSGQDATLKLFWSLLRNYSSKRVPFVLCVLKLLPPSPLKRTMPFLLWVNITSHLPDATFKSIYYF